MILGFFTGLLVLTRWTMVIGGVALLVLSLGVKSPMPVCDGARMHRGDTCRVSGEELTVSEVAEHESDAQLGLRVMGGVALAGGAIWFLALDSGGRRRTRARYHAPR